MRRLALLVALALVAAAPPPAKPPAKPPATAAKPPGGPPAAGETEAARETPPWARKWLGRWSLYEDGEGGQACTLWFVPGLSIGGAALQLTPTCRQNFPLEDVAGWTLSDTKAKRPHILFIDALRKPVLDFAASSADLPWSVALPDRGDGTSGRSALLERDRETPTHSTIRQMFKEGGFNLSGPDKRDWCGFVTTATSATGGKLDQQGHCARRWKGKGWTSWEWKDGKLLLKGKAGAVLVTMTRGDDLSFENGSSADPLFFGPGGIQMS